MSTRDRFRFLPVLQGVVYIITGVWPLVSRRTFEKVTGPKADFWLVKVVGGLLAVIGGVLAWSGTRGKEVAEMGLLGAGSAAVLATADVVYPAKDRISDIYLLDAGLELTFIGMWLLKVYYQEKRGGFKNTDQFVTKFI